MIRRANYPVLSAGLSTEIGRSDGFPLKGKPSDPIYLPPNNFLTCPINSPEVEGQTKSTFPNSKSGFGKFNGIPGLGFPNKNKRRNVPFSSQQPPTGRNNRPRQTGRIFNPRSQRERKA